MRGPTRSLAVVVLFAIAFSGARAAPEAVEKFFREVERDPGLAEVFAPLGAKPGPFTVRFDGTQYRLARAPAAPTGVMASPRFGDPGPWLVVYDPVSRRVTHARRLPGTAQAHVEQRDPISGRWRARRISPASIRSRITIPLLGNDQIFIGPSASSTQTLSTAEPTVTTEPAIGCPPAFHVLGDAPVGTAINLLAVSAGFGSEQELDVFRCGAHALFTRLLASDTPIGDAAGLINVFRMDLLDGNPQPLAGRLDCHLEPVSWEDRAAACSDPAAYRGSPWPAPVTGAMATPVADIPLENFDRSRAECRVIFPNTAGVEAAGDLSECVAGVRFDAVVILVNSGTYFGGGDWTTDPPIAVSTLNRVGDEAGVYLLAHELGHALGLHDEYEEGDGPDYTRDRNVMSLGDLLHGIDPWWATSCESEKDGTATCHGSVLNGHCEIVCEAPIPSNCCSPTGLDLTPWPIIGLWEGAQYKECGFFRSRQRCLMRDDPLSDEGTRFFCPACERRMVSELNRWAAPSNDAFDTYIPEPSSLLSSLPSGPAPFSIPREWTTAPPRAGDLRALVKTRFGTAVVDPDRIDAVVKRRLAEGRKTTCRVRITKGSPLQCTTECGDAPASNACADAVAALVDDRSRLSEARAVLGDRRYRMEGIRVRRPR